MKHFEPIINTTVCISTEGKSINKVHNCQMEGMHFCPLTQLFRKQEIRVDPGDEKKKKNPQWIFYFTSTRLICSHKQLLGTQETLSALYCC